MLCILTSNQMYIVHHVKNLEAIQPLVWEL
jgi:hypothetical protein